MIIMKYIKAFNFAPFPHRGILSMEETRESLAVMARETAATHVILTPAGIQDAPQAEDISFDGPWTCTDRELASLIHYAQSLGLKVILKPTVNCRNGVWRAYINFFDHDAPGEALWSRWQESHEKFQLHYAKLAEETGCVMFIAGCEMVMAQRKEALWRDLIAKIRQVYSGPVSYNTDKYQEGEVAWWDAVDVISSSGYYPAGSWEAELDRIEAVVRRFAKPFFFAEIGCPSVKNASLRPNDWTKAPGNSKKTPPEEADEEQAAWYREMLGACHKRPWVGGFGLWDWPADLENPWNATGYSVYGKPALALLKK
jgi:hypothetical protein